ncbi:MAG: hypothetical protein ABW005_05650 [Burkholderiaceae bacterium]
MTKTLFISLPVTDLGAATAFYKALGFSQKPQFSSADGSAMVWGEAMNEAAAAHGGHADVNPMEDHGFMYTRDLADPDGHMWAALWMDPAAMLA